jgi:hypothetical protein
LAIRKNEGFSGVIDPEGHMLFNLKDAVSPGDYPIANCLNRYEPVTPTSSQHADRA